MGSTDAHKVFEHLKLNANSGLIGSIISLNEVAKASDQIGDSVNRFDVDLFLRYWKIDSAEDVEFEHERSVFSICEFVAENANLRDEPCDPIATEFPVEQLIENLSPNKAFDSVAAAETRRLGMKSNFRVRIERVYFGVLKAFLILALTVMFVVLALYASTGWQLVVCLIVYLVSFTLLAHPHFDAQRIRRFEIEQNIRDATGIQAGS